MVGRKYFARQYLLVWKHLPILTEDCIVICECAQSYVDHVVVILSKKISKTGLADG